MNSTKNKTRKTYKKANEDMRDLAARRIQQFMKRPLVEKRRASMFLKNICSDSNVCIAFGIEQPKIYNFFRNYVNKEYMRVPFSRIGEASVNGVIYRIRYERDGYISYAALKSTVNIQSDNLAYEYLIGKYLNKMSKYYPAITQTYGLIRYADDTNYSRAVNGIQNRQQLDALEFRVNNKDTLSDNTIRDACTNPQKYAILLQDIKDNISLGNLVARGNISHILLSLHQVYFTLYCLRNSYTHYDLHMGNVLCYPVGNQRYIEFVYHLNNGNIIRYNYHRLSYMIDYGRSFYYDTNTNNSNVILNKVCSASIGCPSNCGMMHGFQFLYGQNDPNGIQSHKRNVSADLRLLLLALTDRNVNLPNYLRRYNIVFNGPYSTAESVHSGIESNTIRNVSDAFQMLTNNIHISAQEMRIYYRQNGYVKMGTLIMYENGTTPIQYIPEQQANIVNPRITELQNKIHNHLKKIMEIPDIKTKLKKYQIHLMKYDPKNSLILEIDRELSKYNTALCSKLVQKYVPYKKMKQIVNEKWGPLISGDKFGCSLNVLSFLGIIPKETARTKITCVNVDTGFTMNDIKDLIVRHNKIRNKIDVVKIPFNRENLNTFIYEQLNDESATIVRLYNETQNHYTFIFYKNDVNLFVLDPETEIYNEIRYQDNQFIFVNNNTDAARGFIQFINTSLFIEFITSNKDIPHIESTTKEIVSTPPREITGDMPIHMFLLVAHAEPVRDDNKMESIAFPFHSMSFFKEQDINSFLDIQDIIQDIGEYTKRIMGDLYRPATLTTSMNMGYIRNTTGKISVYPVLWTGRDTDNDVLKNVMGMYHLVYNRQLKNFEVVNKLFGYYDMFLIKEKLQKVYYGEIIREFKNYYKNNKNTYFINVPQNTILMSAFACNTIRPPVDIAPTLRRPGKREYVDTVMNRPFEDDPQPLMAVRPPTPVIEPRRRPRKYPLEELEPKRRTIIEPTRSPVTELEPTPELESVPELEPTPELEPVPELEPTPELESVNINRRLYRRRYEGGNILGENSILGGNSILEGELKYDSADPRDSMVKVKLVSQDEFFKSALKDKHKYIKIENKMKTPFITRKKQGKSNKTRRNLKIKTKQT